MPEGLFTRPRRPQASTTARLAPGRESAGQPHPNFVLLDRFRDFYNVLTREKRSVVRGGGNGGFGGAGGPDAAGGTPKPFGATAGNGAVTGGAPAGGAAAGAATTGGAATGGAGAAPTAVGTAGAGAATAGGPWLVLLSLLQAQARAAAAAEAAASYAEAQYLMAVFADEVFLDLVWPGRAAWAANPLENELFGSSNGRDAVFTHLDALLARGVASDPDLARTYLLALALGFRGRYRGAEERSHLDAYRAQLVDDLRRLGLAPADAAAAQLFPDAYLATRSQGERTKLPAVRIWTAALLSALVLYGIISYRVWERATAPLAAAVSRILASP